MSTTTTLTATMAELKPEAPHGSLWSSYSGPAVPLSTRFPSNMESSLHHHPTVGSSQHPDRPRSGHPMQHPYPYQRYSQDETNAFDRHHTPMQQHHSYPNLKHRAAPYQEIVQDLRDDGTKLTVNHDHKLLSFRKAQDKHTIVDQHGRYQQLELNAQLHGMFFLSEMPSNSSDGSLLQPELTCYRRNLFQISGSLITPRGQLSVIRQETGESVPVSSTEVTISAIESVDGHPVRLIVIPWKTPPPTPPRCPRPPTRNLRLCLIPFQEDGPEADGEYAVYPIGWRRLQFRIATANNGRRKELQQHFVLHLKVVGTLSDGTKAVLTEYTTAPIVVRGRSPRNFQARKEIPLLGSSAGSRGQALVETGLGVVAGPLAVKPQESKLRGLNLELPRTAFTFNASKLPGSPMTMRSNSYPNWSPPGQHPMSSMPSSATASYPPTSIPADSYQKMPLSGPQGYNPEPQEMPLQSSMPPVQLSMVASEQPPSIRTQYAYVPGSSAPPQLSVSTSSMGAPHDHNNLSVPRYVESGRPSKSPRHASHTSVHSAGSISNNESSEYRYGSYVPVNSNQSQMSSPTTYTTGDSNSAGHHQPTRDYYPPPNTWTTTAGEPASVQAYHNTESRPYGYQDQYKSGHAMPPLKTDHHPAPAGYGSYNWSPS
ncbi:Transcription factor [Apiospora phragmitis]|uniref:Transcription factor n=1 Tax=Apiospora phragmitis TaxID=2905665 RepID=A0ABR1UJQ2_9PEZI